MVPYSSYATTVIGAYSVPDWYESLDRLVSVGHLSLASMADAQFRCGEAAILDQELAGIDLITTGEMHRRTHNRHSPPNAMLNYFWQKIPAFQGPTRPRSITSHDPDVFHPVATCKGRIHDTVDLGLVAEFKAYAAIARTPIKITMTGPHMLAHVAFDEHYGNISKMMDDLAQLLRRNFRSLADAGCKHLQIDEPMFTVASEEEVAAAVAAVNTAIDGISNRMQVSVHLCQGNYAVAKEYDGQIGHRYFDDGRYKADLACKIDCAAFLVEYDMAHHFERHLGNKQLGIGAVDVQDPKIESGETIAERVKAQRWLAPEQTLITSSCGFNHLPRHVAMGKMKAMVAGKKILSARVH